MGQNLAAETSQGSSGDSGSIRIAARDTVQFDGSLPSQLNGRPLSFDSGARVDTVGSGKGGDLEIFTGSLSVTNGAGLTARTFETGNGGNIRIHARDTVRVDGTASNLTSVLDGVFLFNRSSINSGAGFGTGNSGDVEITARSLSITNGAGLDATTLGSGKGGTIRLRIQDDITVAGERPNGQFGNGQSIDLRSDISASTSTTGQGGNIDMTTGSLFLRDGAQLNIFTSGSGNAGTIQIVARDQIVLSGSGSSGITSDINSFSGMGSGSAGDIRLTTGSLALQDGNTINAASIGSGNSGNIWIAAKDSISLSGKATDGDGLGSVITSRVVQPFGGSSGNITISAQNLLMMDDARINTRTGAASNAGNITISLGDTFRANNGVVVARSDQSGGGQIDIRAKRIVLQGNSDIVTSVASGAGNGGNITLTAKGIVALDDSDILAFARDGKGGNITFRTPVFLSRNYRPAPSGTDPATLDGNNRVDISASGAVSGVIAVPGDSFIQNGVVQLPDTLADPSNQIDRRCIPKGAGHNSSFVITGTGGIPASPTDPLVQQGAVMELVALPEEGECGNRGTGEQRR